MLTHPERDADKWFLLPQSFRWTAWSWRRLRILALHWTGSNKLDSSSEVARKEQLYYHLIPQTQSTAIKLDHAPLGGTTVVKNMIAKSE